MAFADQLPPQSSGSRFQSLHRAPARPALNSSLPHPPINRAAEPRRLIEQRLPSTGYSVLKLFVLYALKEEPQPQVRDARGFSKRNPAPCNPSKKSSVVPAM